MNKPSRDFRQQHTPTEIRLNRDNASLDVDFEDGKNFSIPIELLRVESPSAEVQGHSADQKKWIGGKRGVMITEINPIGNYAVAIVFDDGHDSGFYTWDILYRFGEHQDAMWAMYLDEIKAAGLSRDPDETAKPAPQHTPYTEGTTILNKPDS
ncbi:MAG: hypothetical protein COB59_09705 [Rhodospirillaceae bacterium]|nr:MAG: hypothetical protein COB59_09705 [Rhodospirillaceae bacterium]